jgi:hypothetical protein
VIFNERQKIGEHFRCRVEAKNTHDFSPLPRLRSARSAPFPVSGNSGWWLQDTARPKAALCPTVINVFLLRAGE